MLRIHCVGLLPSHVQLFVTPRTVAFQAPLSVEFSRQEYWSGLLFPSPGNLPNPGLEPASFTSPALTGRFSTTSATWDTHEGLKICPFNSSLSSDQAWTVQSFCRGQRLDGRKAQKPGTKLQHPIKADARKETVNSNMKGSGEHFPKGVSSLIHSCQGCVMQWGTPYRLTKRTCHIAKPLSKHVPLYVTFLLLALLNQFFWKAT